MDLRRYERLGLDDVAARVLNGERLNAEDGLRLFDCPDVTAVGELAHHRRTELHGDKVFFVRNRHINYTNVCVNRCTFCAYHRDPGQEGGFTLDARTVLAKLAADAAPPREIHIVGGCHPDLRLEYFEDLLGRLRRTFPEAVLKCFTAVEIAHFATLEGISTREVLTRLQAAGLSMLPGGGAEVFAEDVRAKICPRKIDGTEWLRIHGEAHELGLATNCTLLFGHLESRADRVDHLLQLRAQQDATGGFTCFIPLPFLTENSRLKVDNPLDGLEELRTIAVSRLLLDNVPHVKAYWVMLGVKQAQAALFFGADDFDGTVVEEKIGHMAGADSAQALWRRDIEEMIRGCGLTPVERDTLFREVA
ncbi:MAG: aminofutalosine synthase MqnE [Desulfovibrionaceae bacterium]|jgi:aminodeoxyfutalosine synthase|uniref:aminofutalosine synthase MqnE n=1 Tax=Desulfovibrio aminophilus TaxID=81425 RepID=UPI00040F6593|nr:aminofutalosine synthase MqnE [Desulfovibrio aminophilus]MDY0305415.1 aminofutalosine synthase MqnE [Desulfovibrionaceae bacterium]